MSDTPAPASRPVFQWSLLDALVATLETLEHIAELAQDMQAAQVDPEHKAWLVGYRQACRDALDAHTLSVQARQ